jgi:hypothetical protein
VCDLREEEREDEGDGVGQFEHGECERVGLWVWK